eukprot:10122182-Lingulodinium_polyedra.AAC.1
MLSVALPPAVRGRVGCFLEECRELGMRGRRFPARLLVGLVGRARVRLRLLAAKDRLAELRLGL